MDKTNPAAKKRTAHVVSHTHWDREWRYPIWETRLLLVDFMDELIELLETEAYPGFLLDGQVIPVLDYLETRPEQADRVKGLVASGKLHIGPWFTLPDEYPVDGECLVRNLLLGRREAERLGGVLNLGYTSFGWGQTAQLPQIYAGFGMDVALVGKRVGRHRAPHSEFLWRAPDGSELLTTRFGPIGRQNFYFMVHLAALFGTDHFGPGWRYDWANGGIAYHRADREEMEQDHRRLDPPARWFPETIDTTRAELAWSTTDESVLPDDRLMMDGCDYAAGQRFIPEMIRRLNEIDPDPERAWIHTTLDRYVDVMRTRIDRSSLRVVHGELRDGPAGPLTANALTTRLYLKRLNRQAENMLIRFAEPLAAAAALAGAPYPAPLMRKAWRHLLESHPHDSINGVTQDATVHAVECRLRQVVEIAGALGNRSMQELVARIDTSRFAPEDVLLVAFNPLPYPHREIAEAWINLPEPSGWRFTWPFKSEHLQVFDADGRPVGTQWLGQSREAYPVAEIHTRAFPFVCDRNRVFFDTGEVPACGYKVFRVRRAEKVEAGAAWSGPEARTGTLLTSPHTMENEFLRVDINPNGTFDITAKRIGRTFRGLNVYEDRGESGDYWVNQRPAFDQVRTSHGCAARIWASEDGPLHASIVSEVTLPVPTRADRQRGRRGDETAGLTIRTTVRLHAGDPRVHITVEFENRHRDHFLRALFPTAIEGATHADAGGHFNVDRRPIRPQGPDEERVWPDMATQPHCMFVDVSDGEHGIAFLTEGLTEYEVADNADRTVALSLLRAVENRICTELRVESRYPSQDGGQCFGRHTLRYALLPHKGDWRSADVARAAERFNVPMRLVQTRRHDDGTLPAGAASLFAIDNPLVRFSGIKKAEDRDTFIVRLYNPTGDPQTGRVRFAAGPEAAWRTNLNEDREETIPVEADGAVPVNLPPFKILTLELAFPRNE